MSGIPGIDITASVVERYLMPGDFCVSREPMRVTTILGSCVSLCLFDAVAGIGGINHFLLPGAPTADEHDRLRWSDAACLGLFEQVLAAGARRARLQAKAFGGASVGQHCTADRLRIGEKNAGAAMAMAMQWQLPMLASDLGGNAGRKLVFETHTGKAWVRTLVQRVGDDAQSR